MILHKLNILIITFIAFVHNSLCDTDDVVLAAFKDWSLSQTSLPIPARDIQPFYDESFEPDLIYMTGGTTCPSCLWKYNISNNSFSVQDNLATTGSANYAAYFSSVMIDGVLFWLDRDANLFTYNVTSGANLLAAASIGTAYRACMTKHPNKNELYIQGGSGGSYCTNSTNFYIYNC